jgi:predicted lipoprotein with Yx(FWY)xxD motif
MHKPAPHRFSTLKIAILLAIATTIPIVATPIGPAQAATNKRVVKRAHNASLGKTVLVNLRGLTLYSLSAETNGKFICKRGCLVDWHPLYVAKGVKPTGPVKLGTVKRPDNGRRQVTFKGRPLYTFDEDAKPGDAKGEGIKDVGTWRAATP